MVLYSIRVTVLLARLTAKVATNLLNIAHTLHRPYANLNNQIEPHYTGNTFIYVLPFQENLISGRKG